VKSETRLVVLKGTEETFERRLRRDHDREKRSSEKLYVYIIVLLLLVEFK